MLCVLRIVLSGLSRLIPMISSRDYSFRSFIINCENDSRCNKRELVEDMTLIIKTICVLLKAKFSGVNSSYSKIWRGREEAIT
jgi:hypothetical protein